LDTINRLAVACVWELEIIAAKQIIWRETMLKPQPETAAYFEIRCGLVCNFADSMGGHKGLVFLKKGDHARRLTPLPNCQKQPLV